MKIESETQVMTQAQRELAELKARKANELAARNGNGSAIALQSGPKDKVTLCTDLSGSMSMNFFSITRADAAKRAMDKIILASNSRETHYGLISFTHEAYEIHKMGSPYASFLTTKFQPTGGTNLHTALQKCLIQQPTRVIVLTDGETSYQYDCLELAKSTYAPRKIKIDTVAIGEASDAFLRDLSEITNGHFQRAANPDELDKLFIQLEPKNYLQLEHK